MSVRILGIDKCINLQKLEKKKSIVHYFSLMKESVVTNSRDAWEHDRSVTVSQSQKFCCKEVDNPQSDDAYYAQLMWED